MDTSNQFALLTILVAIVVVFVIHDKTLAVLMIGALIGYYFAVCNHQTHGGPMDNGKGVPKGVPKGAPKSIEHFSTSPPDYSLTHKDPLKLEKYLGDIDFDSIDSLRFADVDGSNEDEPNEDEPDEDEPNEDEPDEDKPDEDKPDEDKPDEDKPTDINRSARANKSASTKHMGVSHTRKDLCVDYQASLYPMNGDERVAQNQLSRNDTTKSIAGSIRNRQSQASKYMSEEVAQAEARRWWGRGEQ